MKAIKRILVILDPNDDNHIEIDRALSVSSQNDSEVLVVAFCHFSDLNLLSSTEYHEQLKANLEAIALAKVNRRVDELKSQGNNISARVEWCDHMAVAALALVKKLDIDLLIKTPNPTSLLGKLVTTPTDWGILRSCPCPVWLVKKENNMAGPVVAAIDVSSLDQNARAIAEKVIHTANFFSHLQGSQLHVLNASPCMPVGAKVEFVGVYENAFEEKEKQKNERALEKLVKSVDVLESHQHVVPGSPKQVIADYLKAHSTGLLVIGTSARKGVSALLTGNTVESLVSSLPCDILVVKLPGFSD